MDQAQEQSQPSIRERIGSFLTSQEQPAPEPQAPEVDVNDPTAVATADEPQEQEVQEQEVQATEPDPTADWTEVEVDGERLQVPPKFAKAFMQERDYTQKRQADAELRKVVEVRAQSLQAQEQVLSQLQPLYVQQALLETQLQSFQGTDWNYLRANDPVEYAARQADHARLLQQHQSLSQQINQGSQYLNQQREVAIAQAAQAALPVIKRAIPDWGAQKDEQLTRFALDQGASPEELRGLAARPWAVILLEKARKYDELQAKRAQLPKTVEKLSPVARPGAKPTHVSAETASYRKNQEQFRKSGGKDSQSLRALLKAHLR
jgi:hypothetical protein